MMTMTSLLPHAVRAAQRGLFIFPVEPMAKTPLVMNNGYRIRWGEAATNNLTTIANWWGYCPQANIGIAAKPSDLLIVDCDEGEGKNGLDQYADIAARYTSQATAYRAFDTYSVRTGGGGAHFYYRWPSGVQASQAGLDRNVDVRNNGGVRGGYVLGAGSVTEKGEYSVELDQEIAPVPPWLFELCRERPRPKPIKNTYAHPVSGDYTGMADKLRLQVEGNRNNCLLWMARQMCGDGAPEKKAIEVLLPAALATGLEERDVLATIMSGYNLQSRGG